MMMEMVKKKSSTLEYTSTAEIGQVFREEFYRCDKFVMSSVTSGILLSQYLKWKLTSFPQPCKRSIFQTLHCQHTVLQMFVIVLVESGGMPFVQKIMLSLKGFWVLGHDNCLSYVDLTYIQNNLPPPKIELKKCSAEWSADSWLLKRFPNLY